MRRCPELSARRRPVLHAELVTSHRDNHLTGKRTARSRIEPTDTSRCANEEIGHKVAASASPLPDSAKLKLPRC